MCGRIACILGSNDLGCATAYRKPGSIEYRKPAIDPSLKNVTQSYNIPPTCMVPVLVSTANDSFEHYRPVERVLVAMRFGIIPSHSTPFPRDKSFAIETHLCRRERLKLSKLYGPLYSKGLRCAIPCLGYYEWQSTKSTVNKQPYFFYNNFNSLDDLQIHHGKFSQEHGWGGVKLLYLAGVYDVSTDSNGKESFSFAILTRDSEDYWLHVHHRMPVVLQSEKDIDMWLSSNAKIVDAMEPVMAQITNVAGHPVSKFVNNTKNNSVKCVEAVEPNKPADKLMREWLATPKKTEESSQDENKNKISIKKWIEKQGTTKDSKSNVNDKNTTKNSKKRTVLEKWLTSSEKKPKTE